MVLELRKVTKQYRGVNAVDGVSLIIPDASFVGIVGQSGAGKSTLLRLINRMNEPTAGQILFDGLEVTALRGKALYEWRRRCAMIFQQFNLIGRLDVLTNVLIGRLAHGNFLRNLLKLWTVRDKALALTALEEFEIAHLAAQQADHLSGGQQQRAAIARALVQEPDLILADEPVASLDPRNSRVVMDALRRINREYGITVLVSIHSLDLARAYCDRLIGMSKGKVVLDVASSALTEDAARVLYDKNDPAHLPAEEAEATALVA